MKKYLTILAAAAMVPAYSVANDPVTNAREAFVAFPSDALHLVSRQMRMDMLAYLDADTIRPVYNALGGLSSLQKPVTDRYLKCQVSPVSAVTFKLLPHKAGNIVAVTYTISNPGHAADSQISFYDADMQPLKTSRFLKLAKLEDFITTRGSEKKEIEELIPFPTVEYTLSPDNNTLTARLTVEDLVSSESYQRLKGHLRDHISYRWTGQRFEEARP